MAPNLACRLIMTARTRDFLCIWTHLLMALCNIHRCAIKDLPFLIPKPLHTQVHGKGFPSIIIPVKASSM